MPVRCFLSLLCAAPDLRGAGEGTYRERSRPQVCQPPGHPFEMRWGARRGWNRVGKGPTRGRTAGTGRYPSTSSCGQAS